MTRVRPRFLWYTLSRRLHSTGRHMSRAMELVDDPRDVEAKKLDSDISSAKPRSKILTALDTHFGAVGGVGERITMPALHTQQDKPRSSASRSQQPRSVPQNRSFFEPKPAPRPELASISSASLTEENSSRLPLMGNAGILSGSSHSNSIKPESSSKSYKKYGGGTKVQVNLPLYSFRDKRFSEPAPIPRRLYVRSMDQANDLVSKLDTTGALGFDLEWRVVFKAKAPPRPTAVLQICDKAIILIIQLSAMKGEFPSKLRAVLEDRNVPKLGVNILNDGIRLGNDFGFRPHALLELGGLARQADPGPRGYIERYFKVTNPDYAEDYLANLEKADSQAAQDEEPSEEKENGSTLPEARSPGSNNDASKESDAVSNKPRKPGAMIALATVTAMYTQRTLNKGPVRSSNWEKDPLLEAQLEYAANDAHCAFVIYERLMKLARENNVTLDPEKYTQDVKWYHIKAKTESAAVHKSSAVAIAMPRPLSLASSSTPTPSVTPFPARDYLPLYADEDVPMAGPSAPNARPAGTDTDDSLAGPSKKVKYGNWSSSGHNTTPGVVKQRPQHIRSYNLWYSMNMPLDEMCKTLRSPDNPLKVGTVIGYVVGALQADPSLHFSFEKIKKLLGSEKASFERYRFWFEALSEGGNIHVNMTRDVAGLTV